MCIHTDLNLHPSQVRKHEAFAFSAVLISFNIIVSWSIHFAENVTVVHFDGDHFYFDSQIEYVCKKVDEVIRKSIEGKISNAINY